MNNFKMKYFSVKFQPSSTRCPATTAQSRTGCCTPAARRPSPTSSSRSESKFIKRFLLKLILCEIAFETIQKCLQYWDPLWPKVL